MCLLNYIRRKKMHWYVKSYVYKQLSKYNMEFVGPCFLSTFGGHTTYVRMGCDEARVEFESAPIHSPGITK